jgi:curved DNA-binding protein CbpA/formylglycine-generating enzyme required for sulfatase activity
MIVKNHDMAAENYYEVLGLRRGAGDEGVKQAFRELAKTLHPDRNPDDPDAERRFKLVNTAYEALKDASRRKAYDEWLAFARKHDRSRMAQWSRLAALAVLLLVGPSVALYWAYVLLEGLDAPQNQRRPVSVAVNSKSQGGKISSSTHREDAVKPSESAATQPKAEPSVAEKTNGAAASPAPSAETSDVPLPVAKSAALPERVKPEPVPQAQPNVEAARSQPAKPEPASQPAPSEEVARTQTAKPQPAPQSVPGGEMSRTQTAKPEVIAALPQAQPQTAPEPQPQAAPAAKPPAASAPAPAATPQPKPSASITPSPPPAAVEQPLPPANDASAPPEEEQAPAAAPTGSVSSPAQAPQSEPQSPRAALRELAGVEEPASPPEAADEPAGASGQRSAVRTAAPAAPTRESAARSMARIIAELKEPNGVPDPSVLSDRRPTVLEPETPRAGSSVETLGANDFSDCDHCPVMSVVTGTEFLNGSPHIANPRSPRSREGRSLAVSKFEVTVAEWNVCVNEGVCRSLHRESAPPHEPVSDISRADASAYAQWLTRKTGKSYRLMKVGGWSGSPDGSAREDQLPRAPARSAGGDCGSPDWNWLNDGDCARANRRTVRGGGSRGEAQPLETTSGFHVARTLGPDG